MVNEYVVVMAQASGASDQQAYVDRLTLLSTEIFWRDHQVWLADRGYMLRPRYMPGWVPSWKDTGKTWGRFEDGQAIRVCTISLYVRASPLSNYVA